VFLIQNSAVERFKIFGETGYNVRVTLKGNNKSIEGVGFGLKIQPSELYGLQPQFLRMDVVGNLRMGESGLQLNLIDLKVTHVNDEDLADRTFIHSFISNWRQQREEDYDHQRIEDDIYQRLPRIAELVEIKRPALIRFDIPYRNAFFFHLMRKGRTLIVNPSSTEAMHVYESLQRHNIPGLTLANSINRVIGRHLVTNAVYAEKFLDNLSDFDFIVLNEIHFMRNFDPELYEKVLRKFGKTAFFTTLYTFETNLPTYEVNGKSDFQLKIREINQNL